jgi:hypothetical protein
VPVTTQDLNRLLDDAAEAAALNTRALRVELRAAEKLVGTLLSAGAVQSISKNSVSQSYAFGGSGTLTTAEVARAWRDLITCHDGSQAALVAAGDATPTDDAILAEMRARLEPVYAASLDLTNLRHA